jgi:hypothetical protein
MASYITLAIRQARNKSAALSAMQTMAVDEAFLRSAGTDIRFASAGAAGTIRMMLRY